MLRKLENQRATKKKKKDNKKKMDTQFVNNFSQLVRRNICI